MNRERAFNDMEYLVHKGNYDRNQEEFEIRMRISKTNRQHNDQKTKYQITNKDLQNIHTKLMIE
jgi:hypothetical protein